MIDEKRLQQWIMFGVDQRMCSSAEYMEIIKLARLGLWARDVARPALEFYTNNWIDESIDRVNSAAAKYALSKYPEASDEAK